MSELEPRADEPAGRSVVLSALRRSWVAIAAAAIVVGVGAYEASLLTDQRFESSSTVVLRGTTPFSPLGEAQGGGDPERFLSNQISLATSFGVLTAAAAAPGVAATEAELVDAVEITPSTSSDAFTVTAAGSTGAQAAARADAVVAAYRQAVTDRVEAQRLDAVQANTTATAAAATAAGAGAATTDADAANAVRAANAAGALVQGQINSRAAQYADNVAAVDPAVVPTEATEPRPARNAFIGAVLAALVAAAVAVWRRGRSREDVEGLVRGSGVPLLGVVAVGARRDQPVAEALAPLVSLRYLTDGRRPGPVLVTGLQHSDSTADVALSLAAAAARDGRSVLLLAPAGDESGVVSRSGLAVAPPALTAAAAGGSVAPGSFAPVPALSHLPGRAGLGVLDAGLLHADALTGVLDGLSAQHDLVVVAAGPVARSPRAFAVLRGCATAVAVVRADRPAAQLSAAWDELQDRLSVAGRSLDGVVVTQKARRGRRVAGPAPAGGAPAQPAGPAGPVGPVPTGAPVQPRPAASPAAGLAKPAAGPAKPAAGPAKPPVSSLAPSRPGGS